MTTPKKQSVRKNTSDLSTPQRSPFLTPCRAVGLRRKIASPSSMQTCQFKTKCVQNSRESSVSDECEVVRTPCLSSETAVRKRKAKCNSPVTSYCKFKGRRLQEGCTDQATHGGEESHGELESLKQTGSNERNSSPSENVPVSEFTEIDLYRINMKKLEINKLKTEINQEEKSLDALRSVIKKWTYCCQEALKDTLQEVCSRNLPQHMTSLLEFFHIPKEMVGYDDDLDDFVPVDNIPFQA